MLPKNDENDLSQFFSKSGNSRRSVIHHKWQSPLSGHEKTPVAVGDIAAIYLRKTIPAPNTSTQIKVDMAIFFK